TRNFLLVQFDQNILFERFSDQELVFALRAIAPENIFRFCEGGEFVHPVEHGWIGWLCITDPIWRENCGRDILHEAKMSILTTNLPPSRLRRYMWTRMNTNALANETADHADGTDRREIRSTVKQESSGSHSSKKKNSGK